MNVMKKIAKQNNVSKQEVRAEIMAAIKAARENPDPHVKTKWESIFPDGNEPTPEEFISTISNMVSAKLCR